MTEPDTGGANDGSDTAPPAKRRSVRLSDDEAWAFLTDGHTGILTTLRRDGYPVALPLWYAVVDRRIYVSTRGKKLQRVRHDRRCSFLVEEGDAWAELRAVHVTGDGRVLDDAEQSLRERIRAELNRKYATHRTPLSAMPDSAREAYTKTPTDTIVELTPHGRLISWDNRRLRS